MVLNSLREADTDIGAAVTLLNEAVEYLKHIEPEHIDKLYKDAVDKAQTYFDDLTAAMAKLRLELQRLDIVP